MIVLLLFMREAVTNPANMAPDLTNTDISVRAAVGVLIFYAAVALLHVVLPAYRCEGYACDWKGVPLTYRLNGPLVMLLVGGVWALLPPELATFSAVNYWTCVGAANAVGLTCSALLLWFSTPERPCRCLTVDQKALRERAAKGEDAMLAVTPSPPRGTAAHYFFGHAFNPRLGGVDLKMLLYSLGASALAWNVLSAAALAHQLQGRVSTALCCYMAMLSWFLLEYMCAEVVHLYTYDLFCEKLGFKICWGCLVFYPFFYCIGVWPLVGSASTSADISLTTALLISLLYLSGWLLTRGANLQKYVAKTRPQTTGWLGMPMTLVPGTRLLCGGFWGLSRHINYAGEVVQAIAIALPGCLISLQQADMRHAALPWLYPLYYVALFIPRALDDETQMRAKYGAHYDAYAARVPYRIVPGLW